MRSLDDLIVADHNRPVLARLAAALIDQVDRRRCCLTRASPTPPVITACNWVVAVGIRNAGAAGQSPGLPGLVTTWRSRPGGHSKGSWTGCSARSTAQRGRDDGINDLVRICILLAAMRRSTGSSPPT